MDGHFLLQGIFPTQGWNPCLLNLLHWQVNSLPLSQQGSPEQRNSSVTYWAEKTRHSVACIPCSFPLLLKKTKKKVRGMNQDWSLKVAPSPLYTVANSSEVSTAVGLGRRKDAGLGDLWDSDKTKSTFPIFDITCFLLCTLKCEYMATIFGLWCFGWLRRKMGRA